MDIGVGLPQYGPLADVAEVPRFAKRVESLGFDSLWLGDRLLTPLDPSDLYPGEPKPYPPEFTRAADPFVVWAASAAATQTVRIGSSTLNAPWYNAAQLARLLTSLDVLSKGRIVAGFGMSWMRDEYRSSNVDWATRGRRMDETVEVLRRWWSDEPVQHDGEFFTIPASTVQLRPYRPGGPQILFAGLTTAAARRVGRSGDGWLTIDGVPEDVLATLWEQVCRSADAAGRDPDRLQRVARINSTPDSTIADLVSRFHHLEAGGYAEAFVDLTYVARSVDHAVDLAAELADALGDTRPAK